jgi:hypothetical protein
MKTSIPEKVVRAAGKEPVHDIHDWKKWWSMRWLIAAGFLEALQQFFDALREGWAFLPAEWQGAVDPGVIAWVGRAAWLCVALSAFARMIQQKKPRLQPQPREDE